MNSNDTDFKDSQSIFTRKNFEEFSYEKYKLSSMKSKMKTRDNFRLPKYKSDNTAIAIT